MPHWARVGLEICLAGAGYAAITVCLLAPLFIAPGSTVLHLGGLGTADTNLILWVLSWGFESLTSDPTNFFNANIFHPVPGMLAGAEHMLGYQPFFASLYALTKNPLLGFNAMVLGSFTTTGLGVYVLLRHWGVRPAAAFFGGFILAYFPRRMTSLSEMQMHANGFLPVALACLDRSLLRGSAAYAAGFAFFLAWQMVCSVYVGFFTITALACYGTALLLWSWRRIQWRGVVSCGLALLVVAVAVGLFHRPLLRRTQVGVIPDYSQSKKLRAFSNEPLRSLYLSPKSLRAGDAHLWRGSTCYLGVVPFLAALGCVFGRRRYGPPWAVAGAATIWLVCHSLSLGPLTNLGGVVIKGPYAYLVDWVPGFSSMRVPSRFAYPAMFGFAALAGLGMGRWLDKVRDEELARRVGMIVLPLALIATSFDYDHAGNRAPVGWRPGQLWGLPRIHRALAKLPKGPVLHISHEIRGQRRFEDLKNMYYSTFYWFPLVNGSTSYVPPAGRVIEDLTHRLPDRQAFDLLQRTTGLRYMTIPTQILNSDAGPAWEKLPVEKIHRYGRSCLFELRTGEADLKDLLLADPDSLDRTLLGNRLRVLSSEERVAGLEISRPMQPVPGRSGVKLSLRITNLSDVAWPVLAADPTRVVSLGVFWRGVNGKTTTPVTRILLASDVPPGETLEEHLVLRRPRLGNWRLRVGIRQGDEWFDEPLEVPEVGKGG